MSVSDKRPNLLQLTINEYDERFDRQVNDQQTNREAESNGAFKREISQSIFSVRFHCAFRSAFLQCVFEGAETFHRRAVSANDLKEDLLDWA